MSVCSIEWVALLLVCSAFFFFLPTLRVRQFFLALCNLGFLITLVPDFRAWAVLVVFLLSGYGVARTVQIYPRRFILAGYLVLLVTAFVVLKGYAFVHLLLPARLFPRAVAMVGLSYMLFRQIQVIVDAYQGQIENLTLWNYANYQLNLFGLIAGPIQRYQQFCESWMRLEPVLEGSDQILRAYLRVFVGVIKINLIAGVCLVGYDHCMAMLGLAQSGGRLRNIEMFMGAFYLYPVYMYFNFSGYCDMVIAGASLFGIKMPENFDRPFLSRNLIEYWTRWHRTLGFWIRDYLFTPMYTAAVRHWPSRAMMFAFLGYFVAFCLAGIWHGSTWNFFVYGLLNGLGVAAAKLWENFLIKRVGRKGTREYMENPRIRRVAIFMNFHYACFTLLFFPGGVLAPIRLLKHVFIA